MNKVQHIVEQVEWLSAQLDGPFPYQDCRTLLKQAREDGKQPSRRVDDLIPDLDSYFYLVESHANGVHHILAWEGNRLAQSQGMLKRSFFQWHTKYRPLEWRINQINTPELYRRIATSNQLRLLLVELIDRLLEEQRLENSARQEQFLLSAA